jgi:hypothetical protein
VLEGVQHLIFDAFSVKETAWLHSFNKSIWSSVNMATRRQIRDHEPVAKNYLKSADKRVPKILPRFDGERFSGTPSQHCFRRPPSDVDCIANRLVL